MVKKCSKDKLSNNINSLEKSSQKAFSLDGNKKITPFVTEYEGRDFRMYPATEGFLQAFAQDLIKFADKEDSLFIEDFAKTKNMFPITVREWCAEYPSIKRAYKEAKEIIGRRREMGAITRKFNDSTIHRTMVFYSDNWREIRDEEILLKQKALDNQPVQKVIVIDKFID